MNWLLRLYPEPWRQRYGEEFAAVLVSQRASLGLVLDVLGGAIDAHLHPQIKNSHSKQTTGDDTMTLAMLQRCAAGGPRLSPQDQRIAAFFMILSSVAIALLYIGLTKLYPHSPAVEAVGYSSFPFLGLIYGQTAYLRRRPWLTQFFILGGGLAGMYIFMLAVCRIGNTL